MSRLSSGFKKTDRRTSPRAAAVACSKRVPTMELVMCNDPCGPQDSNASSCSAVGVSASGHNQQLPPSNHGMMLPSWQQELGRPTDTLRSVDALYRQSHLYQHHIQHVEGLMGAGRASGMIHAGGSQGGWAGSLATPSYQGGTQGVAAPTAYETSESTPIRASSLPVLDALRVVDSQGGLSLPMTRGPRFSMVGSAHQQLLGTVQQEPPPGQLAPYYCIGSKRPSSGGTDHAAPYPPPPLVASMLSGVSRWQWDAFAFADACSPQPLSTLGLHLMKQMGLVEHFQMPLPKLACWLNSIEDGYGAHPYHNRIHAVDVLQKLHMILTEGGLLAALGGNPLMLLAAHLAAMVHDYQHQGVTNDFLVNIEHDLALTYNDERPHENHHVAASWRLTRQPDLDFLCNLTAEQRSQLRTLMINMVLATDMKQHFALSSRFTELQQQLAAGFTTPAQQGALLMQLAIKAADLGHLTASWPVHRRWVAALEEEFFLQGDLEHTRGLPISPMMDRTGDGITKSQTGFLDAVVLPLFTTLAGVLPHCQPMLHAAQENRAHWARTGGATPVGSTAPARQMSRPIWVGGEMGK